jgi:hypothetical protein
MTVPAAGLILALLPVAAPILVIAGATRITRRRSMQVPAWIDCAWSHSSAPFLLGVVSALSTWYVWGSLSAPGTVHDERAYLLQARIFAAGRWTGEVPPLPDFFEQMHVFVVPRLAAKYPPGHALLLVPGMWLGMPGLVPVLFAALAGGLVFAIGRRLADPMIAFLSWALWSTSVASLLWRASYFSETTSTALWLVSVWACVRWRDEAGGSHLAIAAGALAWMFLTRPLTAIAIGAPLGVFVLVAASKRRLWSQVAVAALLAAPILALNFVWHERTLGKWLTNPYEEYSRVYFPSDKPGFGVDASPPQRPLPAEMAALERPIMDLHAAHQPAALPQIAVERTMSLVRTLGEDWRGFLIVLFILGAWRKAGPVRFASASVLALLTAYLVFAHPPNWTVYYVEIFPVFFFIAVHEFFRLGRALVKLDASATRAAVGLTFCLLAPWLVADVLRAREQKEEIVQFHRHAENTLARIPERGAVVFIHYAPTHNHNLSLITNAPDYRAERLWLVYDRGRDNERLLQLTDRAAYRLNTEDWSLDRLR